MFPLISIKYGHCMLTWILKLLSFIWDWFLATCDDEVVPILIACNANWMHYMHYEHSVVRARPALSPVHTQYDQPTRAGGLRPCRSSGRGILSKYFIFANVANDLCGQREHRILLPTIMWMARGTWGSLANDYVDSANMGFSCHCQRFQHYVNGCEVTYMGHTMCANGCEFTYT